MVVPALRLVMMKSSKDSEKLEQRRAQDAGEDQREGDPPERLRSAWRRDPPPPVRGCRSCPASRARTVTTTNDRQNMMWAIRIVQKPSWPAKPAATNCARSAAPQHHLGRGHRQEDQQVGGSSGRRNWNRTSPMATSVPRIGRDDRGQHADLQRGCLIERLRRHLGRAARVLPVVEA